MPPLPVPRPLAPPAPSCSTACTPLAHSEVPLRQRVKCITGGCQLPHALSTARCVLCTARCALCSVRCLLRTRPLAASGAWRARQTSRCCNACCSRPVVQPPGPPCLRLRLHKQLHQPVSACSVTSLHSAAPRVCARAQTSMAMPSTSAVAWSPTTRMEWSGARVWVWVLFLLNDFRPSQDPPAQHSPSLWKRACERTRTTRHPPWPPAAGATPPRGTTSHTCCTWACSATTEASCASTAACRQRRCRQGAGARGGGRAGQSRCCVGKAPPAKVGGAADATQREPSGHMPWPPRDWVPGMPTHPSPLHGATP